MSFLSIKGELLRGAVREYRRQPYYFPLIGAVLEEVQRGLVFADSIEQPHQWYVEHAFGFAQIFGTRSSDFEEDLRRHLIQEKLFSSPKVRLYGAGGFLHTWQDHGVQSERQRYVLDKDKFERTLRENRQKPLIKFESVTSANVDSIERLFGVTERFWASQVDFIKCARTVVALLDGRMASICYAAAQSGGSLEIDVLTHPESRGKGVGHAVVVEFVRKSLEEGLTPLWDCYTNNVGSVALGKSVGFIPWGTPYPFFTIEREREKK